MRSHIRFGEYYHWAPNILGHIDGSRFRHEFGPPDENRLEGVDAFVPLSLPDIRAMQQVRGPLAAKALVPTRNALELANHKINFYDFLVAHGFESNVPRVIESPSRFPVVAKLAYGSNGSSVWIVEHDDQLDELLNRHPRDELFFSEYIADTREYAFHLLAKHGEILWSGLVEHDHSESGSRPYIRGRDGAIGTSQRRGDFPELKVLHAIIARLGFSGTACFDFKMVDATPKIFEVNPRPGYSLALFINEYLDALLDQLA